MNNYSYLNSVLKINLLFQISKEEKTRTREMISLEKQELAEKNEASGSNIIDSNNSNNNDNNKASTKTKNSNLECNGYQFFYSIKPKLIFNNNISNINHIKNIDISLKCKNEDNEDNTSKEEKEKEDLEFLKRMIRNSNDSFDYIDENDMDIDQIINSSTFSQENSNNNNKENQEDDNDVELYDEDNYFNNLPESEKLLKQEQFKKKLLLQQYSILYLPQEIIFHIFQFLDVYSLIQISSTNSLLQLIGNDNELWKKISLDKFGCSTVCPNPYYPYWKPYFKSFQIYKGVWDTNKKGKIFITNNYKTITHAGDYLGSYQSARGTEPITSGIVYWEFYINTLSSNQTGFHLVVGVVPESFTIWQTYLTSNGGWGYLADGRKANNSGNGVTFAQNFVQGSTIGVLVDMNQKTLSFYHNGVYQGIAFNNIEGPVYPGVSLLTGGQSVSFVENPKFPKIS